MTEQSDENITKNTLESQLDQYDLKQSAPLLEDAAKRLNETKQTIKQNVFDALKHITYPWVLVIFLAIYVAILYPLSDNNLFQQSYFKSVIDIAGKIYIFIMGVVLSDWAKRV